MVNSGQAFATINPAFNRYGYNGRNEVIESARYLGSDISDTSSPVSAEYRAYNYDLIGNRILHTEGTDIGTYTTNGLNQYIHQVPPQGGTNNFKYDDDGNLTEITEGSGTTQHKYNGENRLITIQPATPADGDKKIEFTYDYMGRRVNKKVYTYTSASWFLTSDVLFLYDGWNMISEWPAGGALSDAKFYVWGLDLSQTLQSAGGIGGLIASFSILAADLNVDGDVDGSDLVQLINNPGLIDMALFDSQYSQAKPSSISGFYGYYFLFDINGNVGQLVDSGSGEIVAHYEHDPFGNQIVATGSVAKDNAFRFSTKYFDAEKNLYYYGYRYYLPKIGRWINRDPIEEVGGNNLYALAENDSLNFTDLYGLCICGPDVTEWFYKEIKAHLDYAKRNVKKLGPSIFLFRDQAAYNMAYKWMDFIIQGCGTEKCEHTVLLADLCIRKNQLGNIMFMIVGSIYPPFPFSRQGVAQQGYKINKGRYPKDHPHAENYGIFAGTPRTDNLAAFSFGTYIGENWNRLTSYKDLETFLQKAYQNKEAFNYYTNLMDGEKGIPTEIDLRNLTFVPEYGGFRTSECKKCNAPRAEKWQGKSSFEARKYLFKTHKEYKQEGGKMEIDEWLKFNYENYKSSSY